MTNKILDEKKVLLVIICKDESEVQYHREFFQTTQFTFPRANFFKVELSLAMKNQSLAITCNMIRKFCLRTQSREKIFSTLEFFAA